MTFANVVFFALSGHLRAKSDVPCARHEEPDESEVIFFTAFQEQGSRIDVTCVFVAHRHGWAEWLDGDEGGGDRSGGG